MLTLRPAGPADEPFFFQVYASTRHEEMTLVEWPVEQKQAFLSNQFNAQRHHYLTFYPTATYHVIMQNEMAIGRLIVQRAEAEILLMDLALLPVYRNRGIGTQLIRALQIEAQLAGQAVRLHVIIFSPALRLYQRLGFTQMAESGIYWEMVWRPSANAMSELRRIADAD